MSWLLPSRFGISQRRDLNCPLMSTLVTFAVPEESGPFRKLKLPDVRICVTGMGAQAAEQRVRAELDRERPDRVLSCGFCGALNPSLGRKTLLLGDDLDSVFEPAAVGVQRCKFHCADRVAVTAHEKEMLFRQTACDAVEMESGIIRRICGELGIPSATLRVVSDAADEDLPLDFNKLMNTKGGIHFGRLALEVARRPGMIPRLMRLQKQSSQAAAVLSAGLKNILDRLS